MERIHRSKDSEECGKWQPLRARERLTAASPITTVTRSTYTAAGQPIACAPARFHIHTDHLGSVSVLSKYSDGYVRSGSQVYYEPFGPYRLAPTKDITDRAFTGQRENMDWGRYYYNARYYVPYIDTEGLNAVH